MELLTAYSHTAQPAELQRCSNGHLIAANRGERTVQKPAWSLRDRVDAPAGN